MTLDVYFKDTIADMIKANILSVVLSAVANGAGNIEFMRGGLLLGQSLCVGFGISWKEVLSDLRIQARIGGWIELLEDANAPLSINKIAKNNP